MNFQLFGSETSSMVFTGNKFSSQMTPGDTHVFLFECLLASLPPLAF